MTPTVDPKDIRAVALAMAEARGFRRLCLPHRPVEAVCEGEAASAWMLRPCVHRRRGRHSGTGAGWN